MKHRLLAAVALVALAAASCTQGEPSGRRSPSPARDEIVVGTPADTYRTDGDLATLGMFPINANIFETLVRMAPDFRVEAGLAERWEYLGENTWRFHLRKGVAFHNGQPFTAEAVKFTLDRAARFPGGGSLRVGPDSTKVIDDHTVEVTPTAPNLRLVDQLVHPNYGIIAPGTEVGTNPVGTGPFRYFEYLKDRRLVVDRNDDYWGDKARLRRIEFRFVPDDNTRWLALKSGEIDLMYDLPRETLPEARRTSGIKLEISPPGAAEIMLFNRSGNEPYNVLQDANVRKAVGFAIARKTMVEEVWSGSAEVQSTLTPAALFGSHASLVDGPAFDQGRARALLDEAGWKMGPDGVRVKDGRPLSLTMVNGYPPITVREPMPEFVRSQLQAVGIDVEIVETPKLDDYQSRLSKGEGDIFLERVSQNDANPAFFAAAFFYSGSAGDYPRWFAAGPAFDGLVEQALETPDRGEATQKAAEAMHIAVDEEAVVLPVAAVYWLFAAKREVKGFVRHGSARHVQWAPVSFG